MKVESNEIIELFDNMVGDDKKSVEVARNILSRVLINEDDYTRLNDKQVICLSILEAINGELKISFLTYFITAFKRLRKSLKGEDRKEIVKVLQSLREEEQGLQSKFYDMMGVSR